jgi:hypothetical protein
MRRGEVKMTHYRAVAVSVTVLATIAGCSLLDPEQADVRTYEVDHHGIECGGESLDLCLLAREVGDAAFVAFFPIPEGFEHRWGYRYVLEVTETPIENPPADGSGVRRQLNSVLSETRVASGVSFEVVLTGGERRVKRLGESRFDIYGVAEFECPGDLHCGELDALLVAGRRVLFRMRHGDPGEPIGLEAWSES